jgi:hypothetical protein
MLNYRLECYDMLTYTIESHHGMRHALLVLYDNRKDSPRLLGQTSLAISRRNVSTLCDCESGTMNYRIRCSTGAYRDRPKAYPS